MTDNTQPAPQKQDDALLEELATGFRLMGEDSPLKRFYARLARKDAEHSPTPFDMAEAAMAFSKKLEGLALPENPNDISTGMLEKFTERLSDAEVKALQYAAGRDDTMTRRSALGGFGLMFGAAMTATGATAWTFQSQDSPAPPSPPATSGSKSREPQNPSVPQSTSQDSPAPPSPHATSGSKAREPQDHSVPQSTILLTFGGALITVASLMQNLRKRKENASAFEAERHFPKTAAEILVGTDKQLRQALAARDAREKSGKSM